MQLELAPNEQLIVFCDSYIYLLFHRFQLYMARTMLESLLSDKGGGKKTLKKEVDVQHLAFIDTFHKNSFFWTYLLSFNSQLL